MIHALSGGVGGAKLARGLADVVSPQDLTIVVNTGDDFDHLGLRIMPDFDSSCDESVFQVYCSLSKRIQLPITNTVSAM